MKKTILSLMLVSSSIFAMEGKTMTVYKSPYCGCCEKWIDIMKKEGFKIKTIDTNEVNDIKQKAGLQAGQTSCHTAFVDGYIVEPDILGISVPGMPIGSPGMEQDNIKQAYNIIYINKDGTEGVYESH